MNLALLVAMTIAVPLALFLLVASKVLWMRRRQPLMPFVVAQSEHVAWVAFPSPSGQITINRLGLTAAHAPEAPKPAAPTGG